MIKKRLKILKNQFKNFNIDGYIIPKNDEFFSEYSKTDRLKIISNFSGSAGYAIILKNKNYLFVDGRYTIQAQIESGKNFEIVNFEKIFNCKLFKDLTIGIDPKVFTSNQIKKFFGKSNRIKIISENLIDQLTKPKTDNNKQFFSLPDNISGMSYKRKISNLIKLLKKNSAQYIFISAPENVAWLLNIRGHDNPNSPIPNCKILLDTKKNIFFLSEKNKVGKLINEKKVKKKNIIHPKSFEKFIDSLKGKKVMLDVKTCSIYYEKIFKKKLKVIRTEDPIYLLKSIKNKTEINNMINAHIIDGVALTKFLFWIKEKNKKKISEFNAQNKLEKFRKLNNKYLFPSFSTIAGSGKNGAIVHYKATKKNTKLIKKNDIFLCDSGGQYKYGTTDVTRTLCFKEPSARIKDIYTKVLKGHIAVVTTNLNKFYNGKLIDRRARKFLRQSNLDYEHGTGHGVGYFLNVHEGPQAISKFNKIRIQEGMILSNEPGYYEKEKFGIRIENLIYVKKSKKKLYFENLTLAPLELRLINFEKLDQQEKNYLFEYHLDIYSKISKYLSKPEKKWLASFLAF